MDFIRFHAGCRGLQLRVVQQVDRSRQRSPTVRTCPEGHTALLLEPQGLELSLTAVTELMARLVIQFDSTPNCKVPGGEPTSKLTLTCRSFLEDAGH